MADRPLRFRDLQRPSLVDVGARSTRDGSAEAAASLASSFKSASKTIGDFGEEILTDLGEQEGAIAGALDDPGFKKGLKRLGAYGKAYNNAALRTYAIKVEAEINENAARLEAEAKTDAKGFQGKMDAAAKAQIDEAPAEAQGLIRDAYARRTGQGLARIQGRAVAEDDEENGRVLAEGIDAATDRIGRLRAENTPESNLEADEEQAKLDLLIDAAERDGTLTRTQAGVARIESIKEVTKRVVIAQFREELDNPRGDPIGYIERFRERNKESEALSAEEEEKLEDFLMAELAERNAIVAARESQGRLAREARFREGDREATAAMLAGTLTQSQLLQMVEDERVSPAVARTLLNELQQGDPIVSEPEELAHVNLNVIRLTEDEILNNGKLSWADREAAILERRKQADGWKGTQKAKEAFDRIDRALDIVPGITSLLLTPEERRQRDRALTELYDLVDALPPEERQAAVIESSEKVIQRTIRNTARERAESLKRSLASFIERTGDPEELSKTARKDYDLYVQGKEEAIRKAENRAGSN